MGDNLEWQGVRVSIAVFATGGFRLEAIGIGDGEEMGMRKLTLHHVAYKMLNVVVREPTLPQLRAGRVVGTASYLTPCPCKNDQKGDKFTNNPVVSEYHPTRHINLCRELLSYEIMRLQLGVDARIHLR